MEYSIAHIEGDAAWRRRRWHLVLVIVLRQSTAIQEHVPDAGGQNHTTGTQRGKEIAWRSTSMPRNEDSGSAERKSESMQQCWSAALNHIPRSALPHALPALPRRGHHRRRARRSASAHPGLTLASLLTQGRVRARLKIKDSKMCGGRMASLMQLLVLATMHEGAYQRPQPPAPVAQVLGFCAPLPHQRAEFFRHLERPSEGWRLNGEEDERGGDPILCAVAYRRRRVHGSSCVRRASIRRAEERAGSSASCSQQVFRKNLTWERDSIARVAYDPAHIPDCNVHATVGKHFLFHEPIPYAKNGQGYL